MSQRSLELDCLLPVRRPVAASRLPPVLPFQSSVALRCSWGLQMYQKGWAFAPGTGIADAR